MVATLYGAGLRRSESVALGLPDYEPSTGALGVRSGKGRKARYAYLPAGGRAAMDAWIEVRGDEPGPLLCPVRKDGLVTVRRMSAYSGASRSPIPTEADHRFRAKPITHSD